MKSTIDHLTPKELLALAHFYDTEAYTALRKLIDAERLELAKSHVEQTDIMQIRHLSGQSTALKKLINTLKLISTSQEKKKSWDYS